LHYIEATEEVPWILGMNAFKALAAVPTACVSLQPHLTYISIPKMLFSRKS
jgi:hypothetical protein